MFNRIVRLVLIGVLSIVLVSGVLSCDSQRFTERDGKWLIDGFPQYIFQPLDSTWEPHFCPTPNCVIFYGKKGTGTHIGVFLHEAFPVGPAELMAHYVKSGSVNHRRVTYGPAIFREGVMTICENEFYSAGAKVLALEIFVILPTSADLIGFTFKRRIEVQSSDSRKETGLQVEANWKAAGPEAQEFVDFVSHFREQPVR